MPSETIEDLITKTVRLLDVEEKKVTLNYVVDKLIKYRIKKYKLINRFFVFKIIWYVLRYQLCCYSLKN